jgi:type II secretory pathway component PulL
MDGHHGTRARWRRVLSLAALFLVLLAGSATAALWSAR